MTKFVAGRVVRLLTLMIGVAVGTFALMSASPVDPIEAYVGADSVQMSSEQRAQIAERWGLDDPPVERFVAWAGQVVQGNLGTSQVFNAPVTEVIGEKFASSLILMATAWLLSGLIGFGLGVLAGARHGSWLDKGISWWAYTLASAPVFWVGLLLLYVFSVSLQWTPVCCAGPIGALPGEVSLLERLHHLLLPALTLSVVGVAPVILHTRQAVVEVLGSDQVTFARSLGESPRGVIVHRVLRNAAGPALMLQFASLGELFGGSVLAEQVFNYPGLGQAITTAALRQDIPLLMGISLAMALFVFAGNLIGDLLHTRVDPRVQLTAGAGR
ncbi:ABC transporter permease [Nocardioides sp. Bht2]|uniref:ABC transporter permease n=1 Tax=Nocardioides sp. Bht2 TaxID=3392297 RepID=UPI0039B63B31